MDLSLLLLTTPMIPPTPPVTGVPGAAVVVAPPVERPGAEGPPAGALLRLAVAGPGDESRPPGAGAGEESRPPGPGPACRCPLCGGPETPGVPCCPAGIGWKSSFVIGSLYFLRRNRCSTRT